MTDYSLIPTGGAGGVRDAAVEVVAAALVLAREPGPDPLCDVPHLDLGLRCTLPPGHDGRHQARDIGVRGRLVHWTAPEFDRKSS